MAVKKKVAKKKVAKKKVAKKKTSKGKGLATVNANKEVANYQERLASMAKTDAGRGHQIGEGNFISTQGGQFSFGDNILGEVMNVVIVDFTYENAYYDKVYDPDNPEPPACFAIGDDPDVLVAHPTSPDMQGGKKHECEGCEMNDWETSNTGKGKACKNGVRLALINAEDMSKVNAAAEPKFLRVAPTSLKHFEKYKDQFTRVTGMPLLAAVTEVELVPEKTWYELHFTLVDQMTDDQQLQNMLAVHDAYEDALREPYDVSGYQPERRPTRRSGGRSTAKRGGRSTAKKAAPKKKRARAAKY